jgi:hypothetical protein
MKLGKFFGTLVRTPINVELSKLDAHLLEDIGMNTSNARTNTIRVPLEAGVRLM